MRRNTIAPKLIMGSTAILLVTTFVSLSYAQNQPVQEPQLYRVSQIQLKPGMSLEFEAFLKNVIPLMKESGVRQLSIWKTAQIGEGDVYTILGPMKSLAELDAPGLMEGSAPPALVATMLSAVQRMVAGVQNSVIVMRPDLGVSPKEGYELNFGVLQSATVAPGHNEEFEKRSKEMSDATANVDLKGVLVSKTALGGNPNQYNTLILFDNFADMEATVPALSKALEAAKLPPQTGVVLHIENTVIRRIPELTIAPANQ